MRYGLGLLAIQKQRKKNMITATFLVDWNIRNVSFREIGGAPVIYPLKISL